MTTSLFKQRGRGSRVLTEETRFDKGVYYTNSELSTLFLKSLVNFRLQAAGATLIPRAGLQAEGDPIAVNDGVLGTLVNPTAAYYAVYLDKSDNLDYYADFVVSPGIRTGNKYNLRNGWGVAILKDGTAHNISEPAEDRHLTATAYDLKLNDFDTLTKYRPLTTAFTYRRYGFIEAVANSGVYKMTKIKVERSALGAFSLTHTAVTPKDVTLSEAVAVGYNMLKDNPYTFTNQNTGVLEAQGILPYHPTTGEIMLTANSGEQIKFVLIYNYEGGITYRAQLEYRAENSSTWTVLRPYSAATFINGAEVSHTFAPQDSKFSLRWSIGVASGSVIDTNTEQIAVLPLYELNKTELRDLGAKDFDLSTAKGMIQFGTMLVLWGVEGAEHVLFGSDIDDPSYFPFPYNTESFDEEVVTITPYLDMLLVITTNKIYLLTGGPTFQNMNKVTIQDNIGLTFGDSTTLRVVKNMVFFRSRDRFYMMVPNTNVESRTDLYLVNISKPIELLMDNFQYYLKDILLTTYSLVSIEDITLLDYSTYVDNVSVYNTYKLNVDGIMIDFTMIYNVEDRVWLFDVMESNPAMIKYKSARTQEPITFSAYLAEDNKTMLEIIKTVRTSAKDDFILNGRTTRTFGNYQCMETGSRALATMTKKRFREIQYTINNIEGSTLYFYNAFELDGTDRQTYIRYEIVYDTDPISPNYGTIYVERIEDVNAIVAGQTSLDAWELDLSKFPDLDVVKIRFKVSGKGYRPNFKFISKNEKRFELGNYAWVYRVMNAR